MIFSKNHIQTGPINASQFILQSSTLRIIQGHRTLDPRETPRFLEFQKPLEVSKNRNVPARFP